MYSIFKPTFSNQTLNEIKTKIYFKMIAKIDQAYYNVNKLS